MLTQVTKFRRIYKICPLLKYFSRVETGTNDGDSRPSMLERKSNRVGYGRYSIRLTSIICASAQSQKKKKKKKTIYLY